MASRSVQPFPNHYPITQLTEALGQSVNVVVDSKNRHFVERDITKLSHCNVALGRVTVQADAMFGARHPKTNQPRSVVGRVVELAQDAVKQPGVKGQEARIGARILLCQIGVALPVSGMLSGSALRKAYTEAIVPTMEALGDWMGSDEEFAANGLRLMRYKLYDAYRDVGTGYRSFSPMNREEAVNNLGTALRATGGMPSGSAPLVVPPVDFLVAA